MRVLESFELEQVAGGGKAWGHKYNPNNPQSGADPNGVAPEGAPKGIAKKYTGEGEGEGGGEGET